MYPLLCSQWFKEACVADFTIVPQVAGAPVLSEASLVYSQWFFRGLCRRLYHCTFYLARAPVLSEAARIITQKLLLGERAQVRRGRLKMGGSLKRPHI